MPTPKEIELAQLSALRTQLQGEPGAKKFEQLDTYDRWLFVAAAAISAAATALSLTGAAPATGLGNQLFAIAQACGVLGLILAALALIPRLVGFNPNNVASMMVALSRLRSRLKWKGRLTTAAGAFFTIGLVSAAVSPLLIFVPPVAANATVVLGRSLDSSGTGTYVFTLSDAMPRIPTGLAVADLGPGDDSCESATAWDTRAWGSVDDSGKSVLTVSIPSHERPACVRGNWGTSLGPPAAADSGSYTWFVQGQSVGTGTNISYAVDVKGAIAIAISASGYKPGSHLITRLGTWVDGSGCTFNAELKVMASAIVPASGATSTTLSGIWAPETCVAVFVDDGGGPELIQEVPTPLIPSP